MHPISFFDAVVYNNEPKTISQKALENLDEYFYLGNGTRISIFSPDATHPQSRAMKNRQNCYRHWTNVAIKITSYFTIIIPLVVLPAKAILRSYLKVPSIQIEDRFVPSSHIEDRLDTNSLQNISSFLSYQDQAKLAQVAVFTRDAARDTQQYYTEVMAPLKEEIDALPPGPLAEEDFQRLMVALIHSPAAGHPKHWIPVMNSLMNHLGPNDTPDAIIQNHANIAKLLKASAQSISPRQLSQFYSYIGKVQLPNFKPWICYRALEEYSKIEELNSEKLTEITEECLLDHAKKLIQTSTSDYPLSNNRKLVVEEADIDPKDWFGVNSEAGSLFGGNGLNPPMPEILLKALWTHIQSLQASHIDKPLVISLNGRMEAEIPPNFTLNLAQNTTNAGIFFMHNTELDVAQIEKPEYVLGAHLFTFEQMAELAQVQHPNAVQIEN